MIPEQEFCPEDHYLAQDEKELTVLKTSNICSEEGLSKALEMFMSEECQLERLHTFLKKQKHSSNNFLKSQAKQCEILV